MPDGREIRLIEDVTVGGWAAIDERTGVASGGETRADALENLDEAVALHSGEAGEEIDDEESFLRDQGIDPDAIDEEPEFGMLPDERAMIVDRLGELRDRESHLTTEEVAEDLGIDLE